MYNKFILSPKNYDPTSLHLVLKLLINSVHYNFILYSIEKVCEFLKGTRIWLIYPNSQLTNWIFTTFLQLNITTKKGRCFGYFVFRQYIVKNRREWYLCTFRHFFHHMKLDALCDTFFDTKLLKNMVLCPIFFDNILLKRLLKTTLYFGNVWRSLFQGRRGMNLRILFSCCRLWYIIGQTNNHHTSCGKFVALPIYQKIYAHSQAICPSSIPSAPPHPRPPTRSRRRG